MAKRLTDVERADRALSERQLQARIIYRARKYGWITAHAGRARVGPRGQVRTPMLPGWPDLVLMRPPTMMMWELKTELGKLRPEQVEVLKLLAACGVNVAVIRPSDLRLGTVEKLLR